MRTLRSSHRLAEDGATQRTLVHPATGRCGRNRFRDPSPTLAGVRIVKLMPTPAEYADQLERANDEAIAFAEGCTDEEWRAMVPHEEWPVCALIHHVAVSHPMLSGWVDSALAGEPIEGGIEAINQANAEHAVEFAKVGVAETVELLRQNGAAAVTRLRRLQESDLAVTTPFGPAGGQPLSVEQFCKAAIGHPLGHVAHAREALGGGGAEA